MKKIILLMFFLIFCISFSSAAFFDYLTGSAVIEKKNNLALETTEKAIKLIDFSLSECTSRMLGNGECDEICNSVVYNYDYGDCNENHECETDEDCDIGEYCTAQKKCFAGKAGGQQEGGEIIQIAHPKKEVPVGCQNYYFDNISSAMTDYAIINEVPLNEFVKSSFSSHLDTFFNSDEVIYLVVDEILDLCHQIAFEEYPNNLLYVPLRDFLNDIDNSVYNIESFNYELSNFKNFNFDEFSSAAYLYFLRLYNTTTVSSYYLYDGETKEYEIQDLNLQPQQMYLEISGYKIKNLYVTQEFSLIAENGIHSLISEGEFVYFFNFDTPSFYFDTPKVGSKGEILKIEPNEDFFDIVLFNPDVSFSLDVYFDTIEVDNIEMASTLEGLGLNPWTMYFTDKNLLTEGFIDYDSNQVLTSTEIEGMNNQANEIFYHTLLDLAVQDLGYVSSSNLEITEIQPTEQYIQVCRGENRFLSKLSLHLKSLNFMKPFFNLFSK